MRVCMVTPHLPPEQSANALLPVILGTELRGRGVESWFVAHPPGTGGAAARDGQGSLGRVTYVPRRARSRTGRTVGGALFAGARMMLGSRASIRGSDVVHLHSNGFIIEVAGFLARRLGKPYVITLYGTDIWHFDPRRHERFGRIVRGAAHRAFYSRGLRDFADRFGLAPDPSDVIYAPVPAIFQRMDGNARAAFRRHAGVGGGPLLLTVKRLHPVAGHEDLLRALPAIIGRHPGANLLLIGEGEERSRLEGLARELGVQSHVRFLGLLDNAVLPRYYGAADLFVLPSRLESWGAVMLEALACGTPVVATDTVGGLEVRAHFPEDVSIATRENPAAVADAVCRALDRNVRTSAATEEKLRSEFSVPACAQKYLEMYEGARGSHARDRTPD
jgi:glycosyltransferase involved in cell wall biosynthesis